MHIMTSNGWKLLGGSLAPTPKPEKWWRGALSGLRIAKPNDTTWKDWEAKLDHITGPVTD